jgi:hypothetical protein
MRKASTLIGLMVVAFGAVVRAEGPVPAVVAPAPTVVAPAPAVPPPPATAVVAPAPAAVWTPPEKRRPIDLSLAFLPMGIGKLTAPFGSNEVTGGASFAYGVSLAVGYKVIAGLSLGLAPQAIFHVQYKVYPSQLMNPGAAAEYDLMARVAYTLPIVETIGLYAEVLPGYSIISLPGASPAKGLVVAAGAGLVMDMTDRVFANVAVGYQVGFQTVSQMGMSVDNNSRYLRVALGGGVRF